MIHFKKTSVFFPYYLPIITVLLAIVVFFTFKDDKSITNFKTYQFSDNWVLSGPDIDTQTINIPFSKNGTANNVYTLTTTLSHKLAGQYMYFFISAEYTNVYLDGQKVYSFGGQLQRWYGKSPGNGLCLFYIPENFRKGELKIELIPVYTKQNSLTITTMTYGSYNSILINLLCQKKADFLCCISVLFMAVITLIVYFLLRHIKVFENKLIHLFIFDITIFLYILIQSKIIPLFFGHYSFCNDIEYLLLMQIPISYILYLQETTPKDEKKFINICTILLILNEINIFLQIFLQINNIIDFPELLIFSQILLVFSLFTISGYTIYNNIKYIANNKNCLYQIIELLGYFCITICVTIDVIRVRMALTANVTKYSKFALVLISFVFSIKHILNVGDSYSIKHKVKSKELQSTVEQQQHDIEEHKSKLQKMYLDTIHTLVNAIEAKDTYTNGHSLRVAEYSKLIATNYGYTQDQIDDIYICGLLHDIGKIGIPDTIINKQGKLTDEEYNIIKTHPVVGSDILTNISTFPEVVIGARWHHERYDGKGYPDGLSGINIPEIARIIAVADAYDAMTSNRSYRNVLSQETVRAELEKGKSTQFDPEFAQIMIDIVDKDVDYKYHE